MCSKSCDCAGESYARLSRDRVIIDVRRIQDTWPDLPTHLNAVLSTKAYVYFFKVWSYLDRKHPAVVETLSELQLKMLKWSDWKCGRENNVSSKTQRWTWGKWIDRHQTAGLENVRQASMDSHTYDRFLVTSHHYRGKNRKKNWTKFFWWRSLTDNDVSVSVRDLHQKKAKKGFVKE